MNTPICDFVTRYAQSGAHRLHMPGHKGVRVLGCESLDITEIEGADVLYASNGIIWESERNASFLFGTQKTLYSTEGSSLCIRAMIYLALQYAAMVGRRPLIWAGRNVHRTFLSAAAVLDMDVEWLRPERRESILSCRISPKRLREMLQETRDLPAAVYVTSPDYLGNMSDIAALSEICHSFGVLLLVDNAHGAYLKFLSPSRHPMDLGADICCDSAHKTLPVLTGGAYLHISRRVSRQLCDFAENAMKLFASTSPSYLIMQSLDLANGYLSEGFAERLADVCQKAACLKQALSQRGYRFAGDEPAKLTILAKAYGYTGTGLADYLLSRDIVCEFSDPDYVVLMFSVNTTDGDFASLQNALETIEKRPEIPDAPPVPSTAVKVTGIRAAMLSPCETLAAQDCLGRVLASPCVSCPPAVPIAVCGEQIDRNALDCFAYYGIRTLDVLPGPITE